MSHVDSLSSPSESGSQLWSNRGTDSTEVDLSWWAESLKHKQSQHLSPAFAGFKEGTQIIFHLLN